MTTDHEPNLIAHYGDHTVTYEGLDAEASQMLRTQLAKEGTTTTSTQAGTYHVCERCDEYPFRVVIETPWGRIVTLEVCREHASQGFAWLAGFGRGEVLLPMKVESTP